MPVAERISAQRILFPWILSPQKDLLFYISSALAGWIYVAIIAYAILTPENPLNDALTPVHLGEFQIPLTLQLLVALSWGSFSMRRMYGRRWQEPRLILTSGR